VASLPDRLGKYHVLGRIAQGGMAEIYRAKTIGLAGFEKIQALKRIKPEFAREPRFIRSFVDEARIAVELNHRNIVQVFDFGKAGGELFLAMELIDGVDLRTAIRDAARTGIELPVALACHLLGEVAAGLDYAHRKADGRGRSLGIVHCDVSPQNIMLSYEGFVKILDFGVARARFGLGPDKRRLRGKPRYMAPEQTRGDPPSAATDVFALGIISWELLTGLPLFDGRDLQSILAAVRRADVPPACSLNPDVPAYLSSAIARALSVEPDRRGTAADLAEALTGAARTIETGVGARTLAAWLRRIYPPPAPEAVPEPTADKLTAPTKVEVQRAPAPPRPVTEPTASSTLNRLAEPIDEELAQPQALLEKRRVVAVAALLEGGGADERRDLAGLLADLGYKRGAVVPTREGDAVVVVFGLEVAGEDDVATAMGYALDAVEAAAEAGEVAVRIAARVGIGAQRRDQGGFVLVGDAVEEARALAREAEPGRPLLSGGAGRLTSAHYTFRELPARRLARRRLRVLELTGRRSFDERVRVLHERRGRFFGRAHELAELDEALTRAAAENRRVTVAIIGRAGVGKSRLVAEFVARGTSPNPGFLVAVAATPGGKVAPFALVTDLFQTGLNLPPGRGEGARAGLARRLRHVLHQAELEAEDIDEAVTALDLATELRDGAPVGDVEASGDLRNRVTAALAAFRTSFVGRGPTLITILEDLHFVDGASADVFAASLGAPAAGAELLIATALPGPDGAAALPDGIDLVIALDELDPTERRELARDRLAGAGGDQAAEAVAERAGGNPLFIEELAAAVRETGPERIPSSVRDVIVSRVDRLPAPAKRTLQYAAVAGRTFRARILEEVGGPEVQRELQELCDEGLLTRADRASVEAGEGVLSFAHGLIREVVYESLSAPARRQAHEKLGRLLASRYQAGREEPPAQIADHLERGGYRPAAAAYWLRAGRLALAAFDAAAAVDAFSRALDIDDLPRSETARARRREGLAGREQAYRLLGDHAAQGRDIDDLAGLVAGDPAATADVENRRAMRALRLGDYAAAIAATGAAEAAAGEAGDDRAVGEALRLRAEVHERQGDYEQALAAIDRAHHIARRVGASGDEMRAIIGTGRIQLVQARYEAARETYAPVLERLRYRGDPWLERIVRNHLAVIHMCLGEYEAAMSAARRSVDICHRYGDRAREGDNLSVCGIILNEVGRYQEASSYFDRALDIHDRTGSRWSRADCLVYAGACAAARGFPADGLALLDEALALARDLGARYIESNARVARATALLHRDQPGDPAAARAEAAAAVATARAATLLGPEIQGLSRQAEAEWRAGTLDSALTLSTEAVAKLGRQKWVEGAEEDIYFTHYRILSAAGDDLAVDFLARARHGLERKLDLLTDPDWRRAFVRARPYRDILAI
jgi:eukaryotic-like serine/threonine-protein kinase